ncbi:mfs monocarboxylic acid transporter [Ophiostoma piceae UAMH 11346]|uniref:Probable transporter MCH1 n=1 Tax=Ophiostoma piceae (strain UAMH 11346) TaxID=1262450 RepID=S3C6U0_OPHP1|nr:mfs monocarboxylic acid transporter [Ophiostoma piceae UAMH 11346]
MPPSPPLSSASSFASSGSFSPDLSSSRILRRRRNNGLSASATKAARTLAFLSAILSALCAGSVTVFSLYGHIFQERLRYSQFQVNGVAIASSISCYLPVSLMGYVCDRIGPAPLSLLSSALFGIGYGTAALLYKKAASEAAAGAGGHHSGPTTQAYAFMVTAFVFIGTATCAMYLSAVTTCAKNFGRGRHRGLALAAPIAAFGLSGMWQSQLGSRVLYERLPPLPEDGPDAPPRKGDVDVFAFFVFLAVLLAVVGFLGSFTLRVVDEEQLVDDAVEHLERSGLLDGSALFSPSTPGLSSSGHLAPPGDSSARSTRFGPGVSGTSRTATYGTMGRTNPFYDGARSEDEDDDDTAVNETTRILRPARSPRPSSRESENDVLAARLLDPSKDNDEDNDDESNAAEEQARFKKAWVLNAETHRFLTDHTMWLFALGFFFMIGPGEAFINNLGTVIQTLYPPTTVFVGGGGPTTAATHVSIVGMTSTIARLLTGSLTDLLAPRPQTQHLQVAHDSGARDDYGDSDEDEEVNGSAVYEGERSLLRRLTTRLSQLSISRVAFLLAFALLLSAGLAVLASGVVQNHGDRFWIVSGLVGAGYGAVFSLTPIIITVIWGVENFGTNWGIVAMFPALGATFWGLVYSAVYQAGVDASPPPSAGGSAPADDGNHCYGTQCYAPTFWAMSGSVWLACILVLVAWKGRNGWSQRGIVI